MLIISRYSTGTGRFPTWKCYVELFFFGVRASLLCRIGLQWLVKPFLRDLSRGPEMDASKKMQAGLEALLRLSIRLPSPITTLKY